MSKAIEMADLIERDTYPLSPFRPAATLLREQAAEIDTLRTALAEAQKDAGRMREALQPFVIANSSEEYMTLMVRTADITKARAAIDAAMQAGGET